MYPSHIEIETTNRCQLSCVMCPHKDMKRPQGNMSMDTLRKIVDESRGRSKTCYLHQIGEPLLNPEIDKMINYVSAAGIRTSISTNGMILDKWAEKLVRCDLDEIILCQDSMDEEEYQTYRVGGDWLRVHRNIKKYLDAHNKAQSKTEIIIQMIVMNQSKEEIENFRKFWHYVIKGTARVWIKDYSTFAGYVKDLPGDTPPRRHTCSYPFNHLTIHRNGDFCLCCRDYDGFTKMGNINNMSIEEVFNSEAYAEIRRKFEDKDFKGTFCENC